MSRACRDKSLKDSLQRLGPFFWSKDLSSSLCELLQQQKLENIFFFVFDTTMGSVPTKTKSNNQQHYYTRRAKHAGSWYEDDPHVLTRTLQGFIDDATLNVEFGSQQQNSVRALIVPHAGYSYSGPTAAYAYKVLKEYLLSSSQNNNNHPITQIIVLHPSHHHYTQQCLVSNANVLSTPLGDLRVDPELREELLQLEGFDCMTQSMEEDEHSGELQFPYVKHCIGNRNITVTPVMCGSLSTAAEKAYGERLRPILLRDNVLTIVSTDFCHWGRRFRYTPLPNNNNRTPIHQFIQTLDQRGMDAIASLQPGAFAQYLKETSNTICGRHAVAVWLRAMEDANCLVEFLRYAQSSAVQNVSESSVSYASAMATTTTTK